MYEKESVIISDILNEYIKKENLTKDKLKLTCNLDIIRVLILSRFRDYNFETISLDIDNDKEIFLEKLYINEYLRYMKDYNECVIKNIQYLDSIPNVEQRSPQWYIDRKDKISASSIYKVLGTESSKKELILEKIGVECPFISGDAIVHGTISEIISQSLYETRNNIIIKEYGCIPHKDYSFIGASPDGVVYNIIGFDMYNINYDDLHPNDIPSHLSINSIALFGNLLEIKNPYSRTINNDIKKEYKKQITAQQEVCGLYRCDFLENKYNYYNSQEDFLNDKFDYDNNKLNLLSIKEQDKYIKNHYIPLENINMEGNEKGVLLKLKHKSEHKYISELFDLRLHYNKSSIDEWIALKTKEHSTEYDVNDVLYWNVNVYSIKECLFDNEEWEELLKYSTSLWTRILEERLLSDNEISTKYNLECIENEINTNKRTSTDYQDRRLRKKPRATKVIYKF
jgi:putative phage-type endonuclease